MLSILYRPLLAALLLAVAPGVHGAGGTDGNGNTTLGTGAGANLDTDGMGQDANDNTLIGRNAGQFTTIGFRNTFVGADAGQANTTGDENTFIGARAGEANTTGLRNTFVGMAAGLQNTGGVDNVFVGRSTGFANTTGDANTFVGRQAGEDNTGNANTFVGFRAGVENTTGNLNTFVGSSAGLLNTGGVGNTFVGDLAGGSHDTGNNNTFLGRSAGQLNTSGFANVFVGHRAGQNETGSNRLYIENSTASAPLIYGEFDNDIVAINDTLGVGTQLPTSPLHVRRAAGTALIKVEAGGDADQGEQAGFQFINGAFGNPAAHTWDVRPGGVGNLIYNYNGGAVEFTYQTDGDLTLTGDVFTASCNPCTSDYVFEPGYELMPLAELEQFIARNGHLPNVPSEAALQAQGGVALHDFQRRVLEKVEELVLYTLEQAESIRKQKDVVQDKEQEIAALKAEVAELRELKVEVAELRGVVRSLVGRERIARLN